MDRHGDSMASLTISHLETLTLKEIYELAREFKVSYYSKLTKRELIFSILKAQAEKDGYFFMDGILEIIPAEVLVFSDLLIIPLVRKIFIFQHHKLEGSIYERVIRYRGKFEHQKKMNDTMVCYMLMLSMMKILKHLKNVSTSRH